LPGDKVLEAICATLLVVYWIVTIIVYNSAPETIPVHFDLNGTVDLYGLKSQLWSGARIVTAIYLLITIVNFFPRYFNYTEEITQENADVEYARASRILRILKLVVILVFVCISASTTFRLTKTLGINPFLLIILTMCLFLIPTIYYIVLNKRNRFQQ